MLACTCTEQKLADSACPGSFLLQYVTLCVEVRVGVHNKMQIHTGAPCGQALPATLEQGRLLLTSDAESDKDGLCCLCGRTERTPALNVSL